MKLRKWILPRTVGEFLSFTFLLFILPFGYWFEAFFVLPTMYPEASLLYPLHCCIGIFFLINVISNFVYILLMDCSIIGEIMPPKMLAPAWKFCDICETVTPPRSWHCSICKTCILKRDHHCKFAGCCIGHQNHRYFLFFLVYLSLGTLYALYFNTYFIIERTGTTLNYLTFLKFIFPLVILLLGDYSVYHCYITFYVINLLGMLFAIFCLYYHGSCVIRGLVMHEKTHNINDYDTGSLKQNIMEVFGDRWYLTWISPFIHSKLPNDGINWIQCGLKNR